MPGTIRDAKSGLGTTLIKALAQQRRMPDDSCRVRAEEKVRRRRAVQLQAGVSDR
jgi:hypothetical protein